MSYSATAWGERRKVESRAGRVRNYVGQLRIYSYIDLVFLLVAAGATFDEVVASSLLWLGFLIFLEWQHRDAGRARWPWAAWAIPWVAAVLYVRGFEVVPFVVLAVLYAQKKRAPALASVAPVVNGGAKASLLLMVHSATAAFAGVVWLATTIRNLLGDFRDIEKDRREGVLTVPVRLGIPHDIWWLYPLGLASTTLLWITLAGLPLWLVVPVWVVQGATYRWTPR